MALNNRMLGFKADEMKALENEWLNAQPMRAECGLCSWMMDGSTEKVLEAQRDHRLGHDIGKRRGRRHLRSLNSFRQSTLTEDDLTEIEIERRARALLTGVEIED